jgi:hypothetical protein
MLTPRLAATETRELRKDRWRRFQQPIRRITLTFRGGAIIRHVPRLTAVQYYHAHKQLRRIWLHKQGVFAELSAAEQRQMHDPFRPSHEHPKPDLLRHRDDLTKARPGLPHQAVKAYAKLIQLAAAHAARVAHAKLHPARTGGGARQHRRVTGVSVKAVVRPEPDAHKLARAIIAAAKTELATELAGRAAKQHSIGRPA